MEGGREEEEETGKVKGRGGREVGSSSRNGS